MRREKIFSRDGFYSFVVQSNVLLHRELIEQGTAILGTLLESRSNPDAVQVLDLACGGQPISIAEMMRRFPHQEFHYTGIDINPDQIASAEHFLFPDNVSRVILREGSAWDLSRLHLEASYDLVFIGMNLHHGTPEEIYFLGRQLHGLLAADGVLINHDWYRPSEEPYLRRPDCSPDNPGESFLLVERQTLDAARIPEFDFPEVTWSKDIPAWKARYINEMARLLCERGGSQAGVLENTQHIQARDYPISAWEGKQVLQSAGFNVRILNYEHSGLPINDYFAMLVASKMVNKKMS